MPFQTPSEYPDNFTQFRKAVEGLGDKFVRPCLRDEDDTLLPFVSLAVEDDGRPSDQPSLDSLDTTLSMLLKPFPEHEGAVRGPSGGEQMPNSDHQSGTFFVGGETEALARLTHYIPTKPSSAAPIATYKQTRNGLLGMDYSSKFSPWLACGSLSPRKIWDAIDKWDEENTERGRGTKDSYWLRFELLWRDYFVCIARKYGNDLFKLGGVQASLDPKKYGKKDGSPEVEWKGAVAELKRGNKGMLTKWLSGRTGVP